MVDIRRPGASAPLRLHQATDFQGGLNLKSDWFRLQENESPDMLNVDVHQSGGIRQREGVTPFFNTPWDGGAGTATYGDATGTYGGTVLGGTYGGTSGADSYVENIWPLYLASGSHRFLIDASDDRIYEYSSGAWTDIGASSNSNGYLNAITYFDRNYITQWAEAACLTWDGTTLTTLSDPAATSWQASIPAVTPTTPGSHMPRARFIATNNEHTFVAYTSEGGTSYPNRIRFSHPGDPGSWREDDWLTIGEAGSGEAITGLASVADHLLIFKRKAVYLLTGYSASSFQIIKIADNIGSICQRTISVGGGRVYFWDPHDGLFVYTPNGYSSDRGAGVQWLFDELHPLLSENLINVDDCTSNAFIGHLDSRIWCRMPMSDSSVATYVFDTVTGTWTKYDLDVGPFLEFDDGDYKFIGANRLDDNYKILQLADTDSEFDDYGDNEYQINAYYTTAWYTAQTPTIRKNWKKPEFVVNYEGEQDIVLRMDVYRDYESEPRKQLAVTRSGTGTVALWDTALWDSAVWAGGFATDDQTFVQKVGSLGRGYGVALKIYVPTDLMNQKVGWNIPHITLKYKEKPIRN